MAILLTWFINCSVCSLGILTVMSAVVLYEVTCLIESLFNGISSLFCIVECTVWCITIPLQLAVFTNFKLSGARSVFDETDAVSAVDSLCSDLLLLHPIHKIAHSNPIQVN